MEDSNEVTGQEKTTTLSKEEIPRYSRQLIMPTIGLEGQEKLKAARVLLIGAGGLGSPAALYLAGAGIGTLGLVDADVVDESNLHRQVIHTEARKGMKKIQSAKAQISQFNRHTKVLTFDTRIERGNASEIIGSPEHNWDIVMDGSDNAATRYLINDACVLAKKPLVSGSALQWEGQITVLNYMGSPCYRCLYPKPPPAAAVTNCSDGGVVGMVPGIIGQIQAVEIVKIILGQPKENLLWRRMIFMDALAMKFRNVQLRAQNVKCVSCGTPEDASTKITSVADFDYDGFCQTGCSLAASITLPAANTVSMECFMSKVEQAPDLNSLALVDVRPPVQFGIVNTNQSTSLKLKAVNLTTKDLRESIDELKGKKTVFIMCRRGNESKVATKLLMEKIEAGELDSEVMNVEGGIEKYIELIDQSLPMY